MRKINICCLLFCISFFAAAQCTISPFIQQNYEFDAKILALREIQGNVNDSDYDNPYIQQARIDYHLEKLSAIYENPDNNASIDSLFNEFQFRVNLEFSDFFVSHKKITFAVPTNVSWVQTLIDTGFSGVTSLDNFMAQYQFTYLSHSTLGGGGNMLFTIITGNDVLNINAIIDDIENIQDIVYAYGLPADLGDRFNYTGVSYGISVFPFGSFSVEACDISFDENQNYVFTLYGNDCFAGCGVSESRYVSISDDCSQVNFSTTLSTEEVEVTGMAIYPNPTSDKLQIQGVTNIQQLEIYSILGTAIKIPLNISSNSINVSSLKNGVYFLKVTDTQNRSTLKKFIKQ